MLGWAAGGCVGCTGVAADGCVGIAAGVTAGVFAGGVAGVVFERAGVASAALAGTLAAPPAAPDAGDALGVFEAVALGSVAEVPDVGSLPHATSTQGMRIVASLCMVPSTRRLRIERELNAVKALTGNPLDHCNSLRSKLARCVAECNERCLSDYQLPPCWLPLLAAWHASHANHSSAAPRSKALVHM